MNHNDQKQVNPQSFMVAFFKINKTVGISFLKNGIRNNYLFFLTKTQKCGIVLPQPKGGKQNEQIC